MSLYPSTSAVSLTLENPTLSETTGAAAPIDRYLAPIAPLADLNLLIVDSAGTVVCNAALDALPAGIAVSFLTGTVAARLSLTTAKYTVAGAYSVVLSYTPDGNYKPCVTSFQWGGWIDTLMANTTSTEALVSAPSYWATNRVDVDNTSAPTLLTLFDTDGITPLATRSIANADGSPVSPRQVLVLGALTPVP